MIIRSEPRSRACYALEKFNFQLIDIKHLLVKVHIVYLLVNRQFYFILLFQRNKIFDFYLYPATYNKRNPIIRPYHEQIKIHSFAIFPIVTSLIDSYMLINNIIFWMVKYMYIHTSTYPVRSFCIFYRKNKFLYANK